MSRIEDDIDENDDDEGDEDNLSSEGISSNKNVQIKSKWIKTRKTYRLENSDYLKENLSVDNTENLDNEIFVEKSPKGRFGRVNKI
mgnify:CR=1 FL=1